MPVFSVTRRGIPRRAGTPTALCRAAEPGGVSGGAPDRPGVAAHLEALAVRRHVRRGLANGVAVATLVFGLSAYLPGTEESLVY